MPELPEVETVVRGLQKSLPGRRITEVRLGKTDFIDDPAELAAALTGARMGGVSRVGKFICCELEANAGDGSQGARQCFLIHLGMTGQLRVHDAAQPAPPHTHCIFALDDGRELRYTDIRRFGRMRIVAESQMERLRGELGTEPLEIGLEDFRARLGARRAMIKALLLDQHVLRGLGNIYVDESLFRARIHPMRVASKLSREQFAALRRAIRETLAAAIRLRGSSISDYVDSAGNRGEYQSRHRVYQRESKPCTRCRENIRRVIVAGRSSYFCPKCQPAPRRKKARRAARTRKMQEKKLSQRAAAD